MKKITQSIISKTKGDCLRAAIASMFELTVEQVPHFILFEDNYFYMMICFIWGLGYNLNYADKKIKFTKKHLINGCIMASVNSKTYKQVSHVVLVNSTGKVIHDPHPNQKWLGINLLKTKQLEGWYCCIERNK